MIDECQNVCGGRCCESFPMSHTPEEIAEKYSWAIASIWSDEATDYDWDIATIGEMLIRIDEPDEERPRYTCAHLRPDGLCGIYSTRPQMCREFPGYNRGGWCTTCRFVPPIPPTHRLTAGG